MEELKSADNYSRMAYQDFDHDICNKFNEMAKEEIKHYDYFTSILNKEKSKENDNDNGFCQILVKTYDDFLLEWKEQILYRINNFK